MTNNQWLNCFDYLVLESTAIAPGCGHSGRSRSLTLMSILRVAKRIHTEADIFPLSFDFDTTDAKIAKKLNLLNRKAAANADKKMRMRKSYSI
ncbi:hypothetical protein SAMD00079811_19150 [Scytonema sp. HK-05]|uniref:hypothetical protein n=1 Tax=Scytonema sp. HK-05 TaxID=1137095 RepID=UPI000936862A|nr:hypothetical protein [Scytonema sp. HK-05]OKH54407.1 hypothetical protein NIES2130_28510 [Scytonema sp. HK-05]BAY44319.1 hypothetical protein SAMD00079811_19150 [Scytonema sp. HK-05]